MQVDPPPLLVAAAGRLCAASNAARPSPLHRLRVRICLVAALCVSCTGMAQAALAPPLHCLPP